MSGEDGGFQLKREYFGQKIHFKAKEDESFREASIREDPAQESKYVYQNPRTITLGNYVEKSFSVVHTEKTKTKSTLIKHVEGGWPDTVENPNELRQINNWKRQKEKKEDFPDKIRKLITYTELVIKQNLRMDVYEEYFETNKNSKDLADDSFTAKIKTVFKDTCEYSRAVSKVCFSPEEQNLIAIAYKLKEDESNALVDRSKLPCLVWNTNNPNTPKHILYPNTNTEIITCAFNNKHSNILGVGCQIGTILIFDLKTDKLLIASELKYCHSEPVRDFIWLKSKNGTEFVTTSTDGKVIWWDIRDLNIPKKIYLCPDGAEIKDTTKDDAEWVKNPKYKPFLLVDKSDVKDENDHGKEYGGLKIEYNPEAGASKFLIVTEQGTIFLANKKKHEAEIGQKYGFNWGRHLGPITGIQRCPHVNKYFLTVGDWTARIWPDDYRIPIYVSKYHPAYLSDCCWTPTRVGIFFLIRNDGMLIAYDICYKTHDYIFNQKICEAALTSMAINNEGDYLIIGDHEGVVHLVKLSKAFYYTDENDKDKKELIANMFEREVTREKGIEQILKKRNIPPKDESIKLQKQEQEIKKRLDKIDESYIPFVNDILHKNLDKKEE